MGVYGVAQSQTRLTRLSSSRATNEIFGFCKYRIQIIYFFNIYSRYLYKIPILYYLEIKCWLKKRKNPNTNKSRKLKVFYNGYNQKVLKYLR